MFQYRWQVAGGKAEDFSFEETDTESFNIIFRYSKGFRRDVIKVGDELLKVLMLSGERKAKPADVKVVAENTLLKKKQKKQNSENKS